MVPARDDEHRERRLADGVERNLSLGWVALDHGRPDGRLDLRRQYLGDVRRRAHQSNEAEREVSGRPATDCVVLGYTLDQCLHIGIAPRHAERRRLDDRQRPQAAGVGDRGDVPWAVVRR